MGNEWAWKTGNFASVEDFLRQQESWNRAGKIAFFVSLGIAVLYLLLFIPLFGMLFNMIRYAAYW